MPGPGTTKYGGNTTCFEIVCDDKRVIIDAGTGIRLLGKKIMIEEENLLDADLFFTHTHMDHIQGLPFLLLFIIQTAMFVYMPDIWLVINMIFMELLEPC